MSIDGKMCRVCLTPQRTSRFNLIFCNNGIMAFQIWQITGLKILEFDGCPALICPRCTCSLKRALDFRTSMILSNERFKQIYKLCRFKDHELSHLSEDEYEVAFKSEPSEEVNILCESNAQYHNEITTEPENYQALKAEVFINVDNIKKEPEDPFHSTTTQETVDIDDFLQNSIKDEPTNVNVNDFHFDDLPDDLLLVLDDELREFDDEDDEEDDESSDESKKPQPPPQPEVRKRGRKTNLQSFLCTICGYKSCSELDRQEHIATSHNKKKRKRNYVHVIGDRDWMCSYCGKSFSTKYDSIQHRKSDHKEEEESCICRFCNKQFNQSLHLRIHIKFTHLEKRFMCPKCGQQFGNPEAFKAHMKLENNERDFVCEICSSSFILRHQLIYHMRKHTGDRRFACDYCGFRFLTKTMLKKHINVVHLKIRPFKCITCNQTFSMKHHLKGHINRVHLQLYPQ